MVQSKVFKIAFFSLIFIGLTPLHAQQNPQIRHCHALNGEFFVADSDADQFGFCKFGQAIIGTVDLLRYLDDGSEDGTDNRADVLSIQAFTNNVQACEPYGQLLQIKKPQGASLSVCQFTDGSLIEINTLLLGRHSEKNCKLSEALGLAR